jgi:hypothetical protein
MKTILKEYPATYRMRSFWGNRTYLNWRRILMKKISHLGLKMMTESLSCIKTLSSRKTKEFKGIDLRRKT